MGNLRDISFSSYDNYQLNISLIYRLVKGDDRIFIEFKDVAYLYI